MSKTAVFVDQPLFDIMHIFAKLHMMGTCYGRSSPNLAFEQQFAPSSLLAFVSIEVSKYLHRLSQYDSV